MPEVRASLELDLADALAQVDQLAQSLETSLSSAAEAGSAAIGDALGSSTGAAADGVAQLGTAADTAAGQTSNLGQSLSGVDAAGALAAGSMGNAKGAIAGLGASTVPAVAGALALAGGVYKLAQAGIDATSAEQRFNDITKQLGITFDNIKVGSLSVSLQKLGTEFGSSTSQMQNSVATILQHANAAGFAGDKAKTYGENMVAMAAKAVAAKPSLGDIATVTEGLERAFARGGPSLSRYGLAIDQASIKALAMNETGAKTATQLTLQDKAYAGLTLAVQKYGAHLGTDIAKGADNAANKQKAFRAELTNTLEALGKPLVAPFFELIQSALPAVEAFGQVLASLATAAFPAIIQAVQIVTPILTTLADVFTTLGPVITLAVDAFVGFKVVGVISALLGTMASGALSLGIALPIVESGALGAAAGLETMSVAMDSNPIGLIAAGVAVLAGALGIFGGSADTAAADQEKLNAASQKYLDILKDTQGAITSAVKAKAGEELASKNAIRDATTLGISTRTLVTEITKSGGAARIQGQAWDFLANTARHYGFNVTANTDAQHLSNATLLQANGVSAAHQASLLRLVAAYQNVRDSVGGTNAELKNAVSQYQQAAEADKALGGAVTGTSMSFQENQVAVDNMVKEISSKIPTASTVFDDYAKSVQSGTSKAVVSVSGYIVSLANEVTSVRTYNTIVENLHRQHWNNLAALVQQQGPAVAGVLGAEILKAGPKVAANMNAQLGGLHKALDDGATVAAKHAQTLAEKLVAEFSKPGLTSKAHDGGHAIGTSVDKGTEAGINAGAGAVVAAGVAMINRMKAAMGVAAKNSPMYFTYYMARDWMDQMVDGLDHGAPAVANAIAGHIDSFKSIAAAGGTSAAAGGGGVGTHFSGPISFSFPNVTTAAEARPVMREAASAFGDVLPGLARFANGRT